MLSQSLDLDAARLELRDRLVDAGLLIPSGSDGLYGHNAVFEAVALAFDAQACALGADDGPERVEFPPLLPRAVFDRIGYMKTFANLAGIVHSYAGSEREHAKVLQREMSGEVAAFELSPTEFTLVPACCYPVYPAATGTLPHGGRLFELRTYCFRHEPSIDPMRMVAFRQREHVRVGSEADVLAWRARWFERAPQLFADLDLEVATDVAHDAFFGRSGQLMANAQQEQELKFEFRIPVYGEEHATACSSLNYHQNHFGELFHIEDADGNEAHSSCIGFGLERCTIALFARHGTDVQRWPAHVRDRLWP